MDRPKPPAKPPSEKPSPGSADDLHIELDWAETEGVQVELGWVAGQPTQEAKPTPEPVTAPTPAPASPEPKPEATPSQHSALSTQHSNQQPSGYRVLANIVVIFVALFIFVRVVALEPFGVPTGSMAPALLGNHRESACLRCGFPVRVGAPSGGWNAADQYDTVLCPNCGQTFSLAEAPDLNGDRLLVDKNVFNLRKPRRWEMGVFHCPDPEPREYRKPYVKRVIGLPTETISILEGEVYANGELLRKGLAELRETRFVIFDMAHVTEPNGWNIRWLVEPTENDPRLPPATARQPAPAGPKVVNAGELILDAAENPQATVSVTYRNWNIDDKEEQPLRVWNSYDGLRSIGRLPFTKRSFDRLPTANDFSFTCDVAVLSASGEASFACRLLDGADSVNAEITVGPKQNGLAILNHDGTGLLATVRGVSLEPGRTHRVEFCFVDRRVILAIDGKAIGQPADLPAIATRGEVRRPLQFGARGCRLVVRNLKLYRDVYYTQFGEHGTQPPHGQPITLGPDQYFMLGDNSGNSQDSRKWANPGVPEAEFIGKPFLIHQPLRPTKMTVRGQERQFQTVDWARFRWLH